MERLHRDSNCQVLAVTSAAAGEGKTVTALNLAGALAQSANTRVLVIDADLHRPSVAKYLGLSQSARTRPWQRQSSTRSTAWLKRFAASNR